MTAKKKKKNGEGNRKQERVRDHGKSALHILAGERTAGKARALSIRFGRDSPTAPREADSGRRPADLTFPGYCRGAGCSTPSAMLPALSDSTSGAGKSSLTDLPNIRFESSGEPACVQIPPVLAEVISSGKVTHRHFYPFVYF